MLIRRLGVHMNENGAEQRLRPAVNLLGLNRLLTMLPGDIQDLAKHHIRRME